VKDKWKKREENKIKEDIQRQSFITSQGYTGAKLVHEQKMANSP